MFYKHKKLWIIIVCIVFAVVIGCGIYLGDYYPADEQALQALVSDDRVTVSELKDGSVLFAPSEPTAGFVFYPGAKVEHIAYAPLMRGLAEEGIQCILIKMPFNLAIFDKNAADGICEQYPEIKTWYLGGHSLGGSMAASYLAEHEEEFEGLCLFASYSLEDLSTMDLDVFSIYGTQDQVLNMEKYEQYRVNLPLDMKEQKIDGGCHAYFGNYGEQKGDGVSAITPEEQQSITVKAIKNVIMRVS